MHSLLQQLVVVESTFYLVRCSFSQRKRSHRSFLVINDGVCIIQGQIDHSMGSSMRVAWFPNESSLVTNP